MKTEEEKQIFWTGEIQLIGKRWNMCIYVYNGKYHADRQFSDPVSLVRFANDNHIHISNWHALDKKYIELLEY